MKKCKITSPHTRSTAMPDYIDIDKAADEIFIKMSLSALISKEEETGLYVSYCPALALYSQGKTERKARENIVEAAELFIESCEEHALEKVLEDCGFSAVSDVRSLSTKETQKTTRHTGLPPQFATAKNINISVEIPMPANSYSTADVFHRNPAC